LTNLLKRRKKGKKGKALLAFRKEEGKWFWGNPENLQGAMIKEEG